MFFGLETCLNVTPIITDVILLQTVVAALTLSMDNKPCRFNFLYQIVYRIYSAIRREFPSQE